MKFIIAALIITIGIAAGTGMTVACEMPQPGTGLESSVQ